MEIYVNTNLSFGAKVGKRLLKSVRQEFNGNQKRVDKFVDLFETTYSNVLDEKTVVDIDKNKRYVFSHLTFPNIAYAYKRFPYYKSSIAHTIINECPKVFGTGEDLLFKNIARKAIENMSVSELENIVREKIKIPKKQKNFLEIINCAKRIKSENPNSQLTSMDFEIMENRILQERTKIPGTLEYELANSTDFDLAHKLRILSQLSS